MKGRDAVKAGTVGSVANVKNPPLSYFGGKWRMGPLLVSLFPEHTTYVEPFGGGASVLLQKPRSKTEVYNDLDDDVVNLFAVLRDEKKAARLVRAVTLTPWSRSEYLAAFALSSDSVERARRLVVRSSMGFGSFALYGVKSGFRSDVGPWYKTYPRQLAAVSARLRGVVVEKMDAFDLIPKYDSPSTLFYVDPPYVADTRGSPSMYNHEMTNADHQKLLELLNNVSGSVVLSGYPHPMYERLLSGWQRRTVTERANTAVKKGERAAKRTEVIWLSPNIKRRSIF